MKETLPPGRRSKRRAGPWDVEVGRRIRARRLDRGMSQSALADQIDLTFQQVQKYENGMNRVGAGRLQQIAEALDVPPSFFFRDQKNGAQSEGKAESMFGALRSVRAMRMLKAFNRIQSRKLQGALVTLAEDLADKA
jgi:transcriptional regulator with XRE-family HTH domain